MKVNLTHLRRVYAEVCRGYYQTEWNGKPLYVRHLTTFDQTEIDGLEADALERTIKRGILTEESKVKWLESKGMWTADEENELARERSYMDNLLKTRAKAGLEWQVKQVDKQLDEARMKISRLANKRAGAIGLTAERVADQAVQFEYVRLSFFTDPQMALPLFSRADMDNQQEDESEGLLGLYIEALGRYSQDTIKQISLSPFFTNHFYLCGDDVSTFFGKPIADLTLYQVNLLSYGHYYRSIFSQHKIPKDIADKPDEIESYITQSQNARDMLSRAGGEGGRVGIVGATKKDFKNMGVEDGTSTMRTAASKGFTNAMDAAKDMGGVTFVDPKG